MLTRVEISRDWKTSPQFVSQCVKRGCPTDSLEAARKWRAENCGRRPPTDPKSIARQIAEERDSDSPEARAKRKEYLEDKPDTPEGVSLPKLPALPKGEGLDLALEGARAVQSESRRLVEEAMLDPEKTSTIAMLLGIHNKAIEGLIRTETMIREELERRNILIPLARAEELARKGFQVIMSRLMALPQNVGPRCTADIHHNTAVLETECSGILIDAQRAFFAGAVTT